MKYLILSCGIMFVCLSEGKNLRASEMSPSQWSTLSQGNDDEINVEFLAGDEIPVNFTAAGDFFESTQPTTGILRIKKNFWLRLQKDQLMASLDGVQFKPLNEVASGQLMAGAGKNSSDGSVNGIQILLEAHRK